MIFFFFFRTGIVMIQRKQSSTPFSHWCRLELWLIPLAMEFLWGSVKHLGMVPRVLDFSGAHRNVWDLKKNQFLIISEKSQTITKSDKFKSKF